MITRSKQRDQLAITQRPLIFPTEIVHHILSYFALAAAPPGPLSIPHLSYADLKNASLVSRQWKSAAYRLLFGRLKVLWRGGRAAKLLRIFEENPELCGLVRHFEVHYTTSYEWADEWDETERASQVREEGILLFPGQMAEWDDPDGEEVEDFDEYVWDARDDDAEAAGDYWWLHDKNERREGSDALWTLISRFSNLRSLNATKMDQPVGEDILRLLQPVTSGLTRVGIISPHSSVLPIIPLLKSVHTISLDYQGGRTGKLSPSDTSPSDTHTDATLVTSDLKYLRLEHLRKETPWPFTTLGLDLKQLVGLNLPHVDSHSFLEITRLLFTTFINLQHLHIRHNSYGDRSLPIIYDVFFMVLQLRPITHLYIDTFPTESQLRSLPPTIEVLDLNCAHNSALPDRLKTVTKWKQLYLPALRKLSLVRPNNESDRWSLAEEEALAKYQPFSIQFRADDWFDLNKLPGLSWNLE
ncbi:hypothetical protein P7C70_g161, partial [Phenoliferia sp. Uapishka_3]